VTTNSSSIWLSIYARVLTSAPAIVSISYSLDGMTNITFSKLIKTSEFVSESGKAISYHSGELLFLDNLTNGIHTLKAYSRDASGNEMNNSVEFTVDSTINTTPTPTPNILTEPTILAITVTVVVLLLVIGSILLYSRHRKPISQNKPNV
jgi:hypothetical protein